MKISDSIAFGTLISTIVFGVLQFVQVPILIYDFNVKTTQNSEIIEIHIANIGLSKANNLIISIDGANIQFVDNISTPYLSDNLRMSKDEMNQDQMFELKTLPPLGDLNLSLNVNSININGTIPSKATITVRSDEVVGIPTSAGNILILEIGAFIIISSFLVARIVNR